MLMIANYAHSLTGAIINRKMGEGKHMGSKTPRFSPTDIPYLTHVWNWMSGCNNHERGICTVPNCWAKSITQRFHERYPNGFEPTVYTEALLSPLGLHKPARIGVAFMGDICCDGIDIEKQYCAQTVMRQGSVYRKGALPDIIHAVTEATPQHNYVFLTKCPQNYKRWGEFSSNCWLGATVTRRKDFLTAIYTLSEVKAGKRWLSIEPMYDEILPDILPAEWDDAIDWVVIGSRTRPTRHPKAEDVDRLIATCDKSHIPVFVKEPLASHMGIKRQEYPRCK